MWISFFFNHPYRSVRNSFSNATATVVVPLVFKVIPRIESRLWIFMFLTLFFLCCRCMKHWTLPNIGCRHWLLPFDFKVGYGYVCVLVVFSTQKVWIRVCHCHWRWSTATQSGKFFHILQCVIFFYFGVRMKTAKRLYHFDSGKIKTSTIQNL